MVHQLRELINAELIIADQVSKWAKICRMFFCGFDVWGILQN